MFGCWGGRIVEKAVKVTSGQNIFIAYLFKDSTVSKRLWAQLVKESECRVREEMLVKSNDSLFREIGLQNGKEKETSYLGKGNVNKVATLE